MKQAAGPETPNLRRFVENSSVAVMTVGPKDSDPIGTLTAGRYARAGSPNADWLQRVTRSAGGGAAVLPFGDKWVVYDREQGDPLGPRPLQAALADALQSHAVVMVTRNPHTAPKEPSPTDLEAEDRLLGDVFASAPDAVVMVLSPNGPEHSGAPGRIPSWIAMSGPKGLLTSDTTRAPGVVSNLDVAPTLATLALGRTPEGSVGHVVRSAPAVDAVESAVRLQTTFHVLAVAGAPACAAIGLLAAVALVCALSVPRRQWWPEWLALAGMLAPVASAIAAGFLPQSVALFVGVSIAGTVGLVLASYALGGLLATGRGDRLPATLLTALSVVILYLVVEVVRGGLAIRLSPLTALFHTGVRFYGLGNELVSLFVPAVLFVAALTLERAEITAASQEGLAGLGLVMAISAFVVGWKTAGANMGGLLTMSIGGGVFWWAVGRRSGVRQAWVPPLGVGLALATLVVWVDASSGQPTHIGAFARNASSGGSGVESILQGKLAIAIRLATSPALLLSAAAGLVLWRWKRLWRPIAEAAGRYPWCGLAARATLVASLAALVLNDTGPVMLALMLMGAAVPLALLARTPPNLRVASPTGLPSDRAADVT